MMSDQLPAGWLSVRVGDLLAEKPCNGLSVKGSESPPGVAALKLSAMGEHGFDYSDVRYLPVEEAEVQDIGVRSGDFFVSRGNGSLHLVGRGTAAQEPPGFVIFPDTMIRLRLRDPLKATRWVDTIWPCPQVRRQIETKAKTTAGIYKISQADLCDVWLNVPPAHEQQRIVEEVEKHLTRIDAGVAALERVQANLKRYRASVLKAAVEGRLVPTEAELARKERRDYEPASKLLARILKERRARWEADELAKLKAKGRAPTDDRWKAKYKEPEPPDTSELPELPEGWCWARLSTVAALKGGITKGQARSAGIILRSVPYLRVANVQRGYLDLVEVKEIEATPDEIEELKLHPGDVLFNEGGDRDKLGRGWVWAGELPECIHQNHVFRARLYMKDVQPRLVSWFGNSFGQRYFVEQGKQTTNLASINLTKLGAFPVPLPPAAEQVRIVAEVERRLSFIDDGERAIRVQLSRAERLRGSVLRHAFEGRLVPPEPNEEPFGGLPQQVNGTTKPTVDGGPVRGRTTKRNWDTGVDA